MERVDAERIHRASVELLWDPGVRVEHEVVVDQLLRAGAQAGSASEVVRFPERLVMACVRQAPREVFLADQAGGGQTIGADLASRVWSAPGMSILRHGEHRPFTSSDMADVARLLDQLPHVDGVFGMSLDDVPPRARDVVGLRTMAENSGKHIRVLCFSPEGASALCEAWQILGSRPRFSIGFTAHGPLRWTHLAVEIFSRTAGHGMPTTINGEPMAGVSGPVTLAGAAAVGNAEILAGLVINQVLEPGRPCIYNLGLAHTFDMRTAIAVTGAPENHLLAQISAAMGRFYRLPSCSWVSTESMCVDSQAALEKSLGFQTHRQSGVNLIWGVGQLESELTFSPAQAVIDNEILGYADRLARGVDVSAETLAVEVTREVGIAGDFLGAEHTLAHFRSALWEPGILCRVTRAAWESEGRRTLADVAEAAADDLIATPREPTLAEDQARGLRELERAFLARVQ